MTPVDRERLRALCDKATPGPWQHERLGIIQGGPMQTYVNGSAMPQLFTSHGADFMEPGDYLANADFVAAANPAAVLALLNEIDRLTVAAKYCEDIDATHKNHREMMLYDLAVERDQLRAEIERLQEENANLRCDAGRYRWMRKPRNSKAAGLIGVYENHGLDSVIDLAMTQEKIHENR